MTTRASYRKRLQQHLGETRGHARGLERCIRQLGGDIGRVAEAAEALQVAARKGIALAQGPLHMVRGTSEQEKLLRNAKTEYTDEAHEIATYTAIESLADVVGDRETAQLARSIRRDEERMARFLERLIPTLTRAVAQGEIPASQRNGAKRRRRRSTARRRRSTARRS